MYSIRFPFLLPNTYAPKEIDNHDEPYVFDTQDEHKLIFTLKAIDKDFSFSGKRYILTIDGFSTEEKAKECVQKVQFGMLWALLQKDIAFEVGFNKNISFFLKNLKELFGKDFKESKEPSIYRSDSLPEFIIGGTGRVKLGTPFHQYMQFLIEGMTQPNIHYVLNNDKLKLALELYNQHLFETSKKAQFLSLVTILEVLSKTPEEEEPEEEKIRQKEEKVKGDEIIDELVDNWISSLEERIKSTEDDGIKKKLEKFKTQNLEKLKSITIEKQIKLLVYDTLKSNSYSNKKAKSKANTALEIYNTRSELVHSGKTDNSKLEKHHSSCKELVRELLELILKNKVTNHSRGD